MIKIKRSTILLSLMTSLLPLILGSCSSEDVADPISDSQDQTIDFLYDSLLTFYESEPNSSYDTANFVEDITILEDAPAGSSTLEIRGTVLLNSTGGDALDFYRISVVSPDSYRFVLSEQDSFVNLDLIVYTLDAFFSGIEENVNYFPSDIDAPRDGTTESVIVPLESSVTYFIVVSAYDTDGVDYEYTVTVEKL